MRRARALIGLMLGLTALAPAVQARTPEPLVLTWLGDGGQLSERTLRSWQGQMAARQAHPDQVVFLIHGYTDTREASSQLFKAVSGNIDDSFRRRGQRVLVVGVQWHAALPGDGVPWKEVHTYLKAVTRARAVGHVALRQLVSRIHKLYPRAPISLFAHSLGAEVAVACAAPDLRYPDTLKEVPPWQSRQKLAFDEIALGQADLDYDIWYRSRVQLPTARMLWLSVAPYEGQGDKTLEERQLVRGKPGATRFPRMTMQQYNGLFKRRAVFFDQKDVTQHSFVFYYSPDRIERLVGNAVYLTKHAAEEPRAGARGDNQVVGSPLGEPEELREMDTILAQPNDVKPLLHWLDSPNMSARVYALWRLEMIQEGGSQHFADETLDKVHLLLRDTPSRVWKERKVSKCESVRNGYYPTEAEMTRAGAPAWAKDERQ